MKVAKDAMTDYHVIQEDENLGDDGKLLPSHHQIHKESLEFLNQKLVRLRVRQL